MPRKMYSFVHVPAEDCSVDPVWDMHLNGEPTQFYIQDGRSYGGGYVVGETETDGYGKLIAATHHKSFTMLSKAQDYAIELHKRSL